jgi:hypothetical protein
MGLVGGQISMLPAANARQITDHVSQQDWRRRLWRGGRAQNGEQGVRVWRQWFLMSRTNMALVQVNLNGLIAHEASLSILAGFANQF